MRTSTLFGAKSFGFFEIYIVSARIGAGGRGGQFFMILCGRLLWTVPKENCLT